MWLGTISKTDGQNWGLVLWIANVHDMGVLWTCQRAIHTYVKLDLSLQGHLRKDLLPLLNCKRPLTIIEHWSYIIANIGRQERAVSREGSQSYCRWHVVCWKKITWAVVSDRSGFEPHFYHTLIVWSWSMISPLWAQPSHQWNMDVIVFV